MFTSAITIDEAVSGWYALIRRAKTAAQTELAYQELVRTVLAVSRFSVLNYSQPAIARFGQLKRMKLNVQANDLRIAAIALEAGAAVVTRNVRDFGRVPGLTVEDWSVP